MMLSAQQVAGICLFGGIGVLVGGLTLFEVWTWHRRRSLIPLRQLVLRVIGGLLLLWLLARVLGGMLYMQEGQQPIRIVLNYWSECVALAWLLIGVVLVDLRLMRKLRQAQRQRIAVMAQQLIDSFRAEHAPRE